MAKRHVALTRKMVEGAIYIDIEKRIDDEIPALIGEFSDGRYMCRITDKHLFKLAYSRAAVCADINTYLNSLLDRSLTSGRKLVAFSEFELGQMKELLPHRTDDLDRMYVNANSVVKRFFNRERRDTMARLRKEKEENQGRYGQKVGLKEYLGLPFVRYHYPRSLQRHFKGAGYTLKILRKQLERKECYIELSDDARMQWRYLVEYNRHDCAGMHHLMTYVNGHRRPVRDPKISGSQGIL